MKKLTVKLTAEQNAFIKSHSQYKAFRGDPASGKTTAGAYDLLLSAAKLTGGDYWVFAPNYKMMQYATLQPFRERAESLGLWDKFLQGDMLAVLTNGATIHFASAESDAIYSYGGEGLWIDNAEHIESTIAAIILGRARGWATMTFTPQPKKFFEWSGQMHAHWTDVVTTSWFNVSAKIEGNKFLDPDTIKQLRKSFPSTGT